MSLVISHETPLQGACLCQNITVSLSSPPILSVACHCHDCQKFTASGFSLTTMFSRASFSYHGELLIGGLKTSQRKHYFCKNCLNFIFSELSTAPDRVNMRSCVLKQGHLFPPFIDVMIQEKLPWIPCTTLRQYMSYPKTQQEFIDLSRAYAERLRDIPARPCEG